jgi:hypothetical protein
MIVLMACGGPFRARRKSFDGALMDEGVERIKRLVIAAEQLRQVGMLIPMLLGMALIALVSRPARLALPLIVLPDISPRIVTGRKTLSSPASPIASVARERRRRTQLLSPRLRGEMPGRAMRGGADLGFCDTVGPISAYDLMRNKCPSTSTSKKL